MIPHEFQPNLNTQEVNDFIREKNFDIIRSPRHHAKATRSQTQNVGLPEYLTKSRMKKAFQLHYQCFGRA